MISAHMNIGRDYGLYEPRTLAPGALRFDVTRVVSALWLVVTIILTLGIVREFAVHYFGVGTMFKDMRHFALDAERSLPSWYENLSMAAASALLTAIAFLSRRLEPRNRIQWSALAVIFLLMAIDGAVSFHEVTVDPLRNAFHLGGIFYFSWVIIATPVVIALGLYFIPFLLRLPRSTAIRMAIAGSVFVGGALGTEFLCGYFASTSGIEALPYMVTAATQECLESIGMTMFVIALIRHLARIAPFIKIDLVQSENR